MSAQKPETKKKKDALSLPPIQSTNSLSDSSLRGLEQEHKPIPKSISVPNLQPLLISEVEKWDLQKAIVWVRKVNEETVFKSGVIEKLFELFGGIQSFVNAAQNNKMIVERHPSLLSKTLDELKKKVWPPKSTMVTRASTSSIESIEENVESKPESIFYPINADKATLEQAIAWMRSPSKVQASAHQLITKLFDRFKHEKHFLRAARMNKEKSPQQQFSKKSHNSSDNTLTQRVSSSSSSTAMTESKSVPNFHSTVSQASLEGAICWIRSPKKVKKSASEDIEQLFERFADKEDFVKAARSNEDIVAKYEKLVTDAEKGIRESQWKKIDAKTASLEEAIVWIKDGGNINKSLKARPRRKITGTLFERFSENKEFLLAAFGNEALVREYAGTLVRGVVSNLLNKMSQQRSDNTNIWKNKSDKNGWDAGVEILTKLENNPFLTAYKNSTYERYGMRADAKRKEINGLEKLMKQVMLRVKAGLDPLGIVPAEQKASDGSVPVVFQSVVIPGTIFTQSSMSSSLAPEMTANNIQKPEVLVDSGECTLS